MRTGWWVAAVSAVTFATGCAAGSEPGRELVLVSAASSLTDAFAALEQPFEIAHPTLDVVFNFGGSTSLVAQVEQGVPADVLAVASETSLDPLLTSDGLTGAPTIFARNELVIAVPAGNPAAVTDLSAFARPELLTGLCAPSVPCGHLAARVLAEADVFPVIDSAEPNVRALLQRIASGELDAGLVYATDARTEPERVLALPVNSSLTTSAAIVALTAGASSSGAEAFVSFVLSPPAQIILAEFGFLSP